jgi:hypothetical protein
LVALGSQKSGMVLHFLCFYGHPTLSTWFTSNNRKARRRWECGERFPFYLFRENYSENSLARLMRSNWFSRCFRRRRYFFA